MSKQCKERLSCSECSLPHPTILHMKPKETAHPQKDKMDNCDRQSVTSALICAEKDTSEVIDFCENDCTLSIVPVQVKTTKGTHLVKTYAFLDQGSSDTFCTEALMSELNVNGRKTDILLRTMGDEKQVKTHIVSGLEISRLDDDKFIQLPDVFTQRTIPVHKGNIPQQKDLERWPYLKEVCLPSIKAEIGLLIGANVPEVMEPWQVISSRDNGPFAVRTKLGWTVNGPLRNSNHVTRKGRNVQVSVNRIAVARLEDLWQQQFKQDFPEAEKDDQLEMSKEDHQFVKMMSESAKLEDGHYSLCLPLKNKAIQMPNNLVVAEQRALNLKRKFIKNPEFHKEYTSFMNSLIKNDYAVKLTEDNHKQTGDNIWYIPHHGVYHPVKQKQSCFRLWGIFSKDVVEPTTFTRP